MSVRDNSLVIDGGQDTPVPAHLNFGWFMFDKIRLMGDEIALHNVDTGEQLTYRQLTQRAVDLAVGFTKLGMGKGDMVMLNDDTIAYMPTALAVIFTGATLCPIFYSIGKAIFKHYLTITKPTYLICTEQFWAKFSTYIEDINTVKTIISWGDLPRSAVTMINLVAQNYEVDKFVPAEVRGQEDVAIVYTSSGTTGLLKAIQLTHLNCILHCLADDYNSIYECGFHCRFWSINYYDFKTFISFASGKKIVYSNVNSTQSILSAIDKYKVDVVFCNPVQVNDLANVKGLEEYNLNSLKIIHSRSAPLQAKIIEKMKKIYPQGVKVVQAYGMSECGELSSEIRVLHTPKGLKIGSVGIPSRGIVLKVVNPQTGENLPPNTEGEIYVKGPAFMKGYIGIDSSTYLNTEGYFKTGDLGYYDEDGYFYIVGRLKDILKVNCLQMAPVHWETVLQMYPGVKEAGVVGKPHPVIGDLPTAFVVRQPGSNVTEQELKDFVAAEVGLPLHGGIYFIPELPRNDRGKIVHAKLREMLN